MRKIAIINYKGGTGKTSTTVNLGYGLSLRKKKVLIIDSDPQGSAGYHLGVSCEKTLYDLLILNTPFRDCCCVVNEFLDIVCSNERLYPAELKMASMKQRELILSKRLANVTGYDYILIDCGPSMNLLNQNALLYCKEVFMPVSMEYFALIGVKQLLKNIRLINKFFNHNLIVSKVIPTFYDQRLRKSKEIFNSLKRVFPDTITRPIRTSVVLSEAPGMKCSVFQYSLNSAGASDYNELVEEVINHG